MKPLRLLLVFAHPDDESMGMGGTIARYTGSGVETHLVCASRGERGWFGPVEEDPGHERLGQLRSLELSLATKELGIREVMYLGYTDGEVDRADPLEASGKIAVQIRRLKPQVVVTFPPDGGYGHPDHIAISQFTSAAVVLAADGSHHDSDNQPPHTISKLYYMVDSEGFVRSVEPVIGDLTFPVANQIRGQVGWKEWMITTRIETTAYCPIAWRAIRCHQSQLASLGPLAQMNETEAVRMLSMQGTFYRVFSLVNGGREIETDLFEGLRQQGNK